MKVIEFNSFIAFQQVSVGEPGCLFRIYVVLSLVHILNQI